MKELHEWLGLSAHTASISAFVQQRNKIKPEALENHKKSDGIVLNDADSVRNISIGKQSISSVQE